MSKLAGPTRVVGMKLLLGWLTLLCFQDSNFVSATVQQFGINGTAPGRVPGKLNVHLVPHTHDDVGWLKTVDQYFTGSNNSIQTANVRSILDTLIDALLKDPNRKFVYVEQAFFQRWWREQSAERRSIVQTLVSNGQLEFINGGWCMHDEATVHYVDMIDQTTLGHRFLKQEFNVVPTVGWQIDPFGHSSVQAYLLGAQLGLSSLFFGRIDYQDFANRQKQKTLEFIWRPSKTFGSSSQIFTGVLYNGYGAPPKFNWDVYSNDPLFQDDPLFSDYNVDEIVEAFVDYAKLQALYYQGDDIMLTMGTDFQYTFSESWFREMDKLILHANQDGRVNAFYSTPSMYTASKLAANATWEVKTDDFFPYADCPNCFWTGYFTSRAALKGFVRDMSALLQAGRQLEYITGKKEKGNTTDSLEEALGILQHHDGVSGTEKQHVAFDYARRLAIGEAETHGTITAALASLASSNAAQISFVQCPGLNISYCPPSESASSSGHSLVVVVYNPLGWNRSEYVRIPVTGPVSVTDSDGSAVTSQLVPVDVTTLRLRAFYAKANYGAQDSNSGPLYWLTFPATVPPLGYSLYTISPSEKTAVTLTSLSTNNSSLKDVEAETDSFKATFSATTGLLKSVTNLAQNVTSVLEQEYYYYVGYDGLDSQDSGAYIFRPNDKTPVNVSTNVSWDLYEGPLLCEVQQQFSPWISQVVRLFKGQDHAEVEFTVGPIPTDDGIGKEVITRVSSNIQSNGTFYTDSNGRDFLKRVRDYRPTWQYQVHEPVAGNYYPLNLGIYLDDGNIDLSVLVDRAEGGASIADGQLEIMLHRRLIQDDARGVGEALDEVVCTSYSCEPLTVRGKHYVSVNPSSKAAQWRRSLGQRILAPLQLAFSVQEGDESPIKLKANFSLFAPGYVLPPNAAILTLQELDNKDVLLRLAHLYEANEDATWSQLAEVDLKQVFSNKKILNATEVSLSANQNRADLKPLLWKVANGEPDPRPLQGAPFTLDAGIVELGPMEIRTFILQLA